MAKDWIEAKWWEVRPEWERARSRPGLTGEEMAERLAGMTEFAEGSAWGEEHGMDPILCKIG